MEEYLLKPIRHTAGHLPGENDEDSENGQGDPAGVRHARDARHLSVLRVVELVDDPWGQVVLPLGDHRYVQHRVIGPGLSGKTSISYPWLRKTKCPHFYENLRELDRTDCYLNVAVNGEV